MTATLSNTRAQIARLATALGVVTMCATRHGLGVANGVVGVPAQPLALPLASAVAPELNAPPGVGVELAGQRLVTAGDTPSRLRSEATFAGWQRIVGCSVDARSGPCHQAPIAGSAGGRC